MTVAHGPVRRRIIMAAAGLGCVAIVLVVLWLLAGIAGAHGSTTSGDHQVTATVRTTASCVGSDTNDTISFVLNGTHLAQLDGCGHATGETLSVLVPASFTGDTVLEPVDAAPGDSSGLSHRVAFLLLVVATAVGGACGYQIFRLRNREPGRRAAVGRRAGTNEASSDLRTGDLDDSGVDWFEDSKASMQPVDLGDRTD